MYEQVYKPPGATGHYYPQMPYPYAEQSGYSTRATIINDFLTAQQMHQADRQRSRQTAPDKDGRSSPRGREMSPRYQTMVDPRMPHAGMVHYGVPPPQSGIMYLQHPAQVGGPVSERGAQRSSPMPPGGAPSPREDKGNLQSLGAPWPAGNPSHSQISPHHSPAMPLDQGHPHYGAQQGRPSITLGTGRPSPKGDPQGHSKPEHHLSQAPDSTTMQSNMVNPAGKEGLEVLVNAAANANSLAVPGDMGHGARISPAPRISQAEAERRHHWHQQQDQERSRLEMEQRRMADQYANRQGEYRQRMYDGKHPNQSEPQYADRPRPNPGFDHRMQMSTADTRAHGTGNWVLNQERLRVMPNSPRTNEGQFGERPKAKTPESNFRTDREYVKQFTPSSTEQTSDRHSQGAAAILSSAFEKDPPQGTQMPSYDPKQKALTAATLIDVIIQNQINKSMEKDSEPSDHSNSRMATVSSSADHRIASPNPVVSTSMSSGSSEAHPNQPPPPHRGRKVICSKYTEETASKGSSNTSSGGSGGMQKMESDSTAAVGPSGPLGQSPGLQCHPGPQPPAVIKEHLKDAGSPESDNSNMSVSSQASINARTITLGEHIDAIITEDYSKKRLGLKCSLLSQLNATNGAKASAGELSLFFVSSFMTVKCLTCRTFYTIFRRHEPLTKPLISKENCCLMEI